MQPSSWNYDKAPGFSDDLLKDRAREALRVIFGRSPRELRYLVQDTRRLHRAYFAGMTPPNAPHWAGNYRGTNVPGLKTYNVSFGGLSGCPARFVDAQMVAFAEQAEKLIGQFDVMWIDQSLTSAAKLYRLAELAAALFVTFLNIHPYADGNGHMSRYIIMSLFAMYGFRLRRLPIHPRPTTAPPLDVLLSQYRAGVRAPLVQYLLSTLAL